MSKRPTIAVCKSHPDRVLRDIAGLMQAAGLSRVLPRDKTVILKDNISWHFPFLSANTTPWQLEGVICALRDGGYQDLVAVHNNTVVTNPYKGGRLNRLTPVYQKHQVAQLYNFRPEHITWTEYQPRAEMLALDRLFPDGIHLPEFFMGKSIVHLPTVKTHVYTTTTGAMKNAFGGLLNTQRHYAHSWIHEILVDLLAIQQEIHTGIFTVMDGTLCGNGPGPRTMMPVEKDYILAGEDSVAIDAVAATMMGFDPMKIPYIRMAHERGLGKGRMEEIEVVGEDITGVDFGFTVGDNLASRMGDLLWFGPMRRLQKLCFHTPLVYLFIFASFLYHDYIWWPFKGMRVQETKVLNTKWGQLFAKYE